MERKCYYVFYIIAITTCPIQKWSYCSSVYGQVRKLGVGNFNGKNYFTKNIILNLLNFTRKLSIGHLFSSLKGDINKILSDKAHLYFQLPVTHRKGPHISGLFFFFP